MMNEVVPRRLVFSDIHGCIKTFRALLYETIKITPDDHLFFLGDYIDRGPDSRAVIDEIMKLQMDNYQVKALRGNHEQLLLNSLHDVEHREVWMRNGGIQTLVSFNVASVHDIPEKYMNFFNALEYYVLLDDFILVHAGLNTAIEDPFSDIYSMLWLRNFIIDPQKVNNRIIVHGHTPTSLSRIKESIAHAHTDYNIVIDNGCVYGIGFERGNLCCLELNDLQLTVVVNQE
jgi:serine/threonine protein phosphatase 1